MRRGFLLLLLLTLPISMILWVSNAFLSTTIGVEVIEPSRWLSATLLPILIAWRGLQGRSLSFSGAVSGLAVGFLLTLGSYVFFANLLVFFISSSKATKFLSSKKRKLEENFKEGGERNWVQVVCNGGVASLLALFYMMDCGCGEHPIDMIYNYRCSWLNLAVLGALSCCNGDTWASEIGTVLSIGDPVLITSLQSVPRGMLLGTNGGISLVGLVVSLMGGFVVGLGHYFTLLMCVSNSIMISAPPQWPIIFVGAIGGLMGSVIDSVLGATVQFSGIDSEGKIVERPGEGVIPICGSNILDNHAVNLISSLLTALFLPRVALLIM
ncbi:transmembrane protein 19-like isoform X1 [Homarus americanus]|uniref:transmembrane protein 19-like isoform X1 n=1 Tax=Homarus americanus TaxID=6706 RepID=UPI001C437D0F|nr:transmembrane protein 19-like isoform X1 [Homarus americanus]